MHREFITRRQLQNVIGSINHLAKAVRYARMFMNKLLDALHEARTYRIMVCDQIRADLNWFHTFLEAYIGKTFIVGGNTILTIEADSCLIGASTTDGQSRYMYTYPSAFKNTHHISQLEALNCLIAVRALVSKEHANSVIEIKCDNLPAISVFQNSCGKGKVMNAIARALWYYVARLNIEIRFTHIPGVDMYVADTLSTAPLSYENEQQALRVMSHRNLRIGCFRVTMILISIFDNLLQVNG